MVFILQDTLHVYSAGLLKACLSNLSKRQEHFRRIITRYTSNMDEALAIFEIGERIVKKVREMKEVGAECVKLADIVSKLQPILEDLKDQLGEPKHRSIMESLMLALTNGEEVVDYIQAHPRYTAYIRTGKYKRKLENAIKDIDSWIVRVQPITSGETLSKLFNLRNEVNEFSNVLNNKLDDISGKLDHLSVDVMRQLRDEISSLVQPIGKSALYQEFIDEEDKRWLAMLETQLAKGDGALDSFFCPLSGDIMVDPVMCVV